MKTDKLKRIGQYIGIFLFILFVWSQGQVRAEAATEKFKEEDIEILGIGEAYQLEILNKKAKSTYQWSSSNKKIVTVSKNGLVRSVNKGSAVITCKITESSGKTRTLRTDVTVLIPATRVRINNAVEKNGAHIMRVGEKYNFNRDITPSNSSDKTYWSIDASNTITNPDAIRIDNASNGTITAMRRGKVVLVATAARYATAKSAEDSDIKDAIIIEVIGDSPEVISSRIINSKTIRIEFATEMRESTLLYSNGTLMDNITVTPLEDSSRNFAKNPGRLTGSLSSNKRILTITAEEYFDGSYGVSFSNLIRSDKGESLYRDYAVLHYTGETPYDENDNGGDYPDPDEGTGFDTVPPKVESIVLDDDGMTTIINFTEKMDFYGLTISDVRLLSNTGQAGLSTFSYIQNPLNYKSSADGKSLRISMSGINDGDYNHAFQATISGITDVAGNFLSGGSAEILIRTETTRRPQARPIYVTRTAYNVITATFDRAIKTPGYAYINRYSYAAGTVDPYDNKKVNYTLQDYDITLTGPQIVSIGFWDSYNVIADDNYANKMYDFTVNFVRETDKPVLTSYQYNPDLNLLTLTYNKEVRLTSQIGSLFYTMSAGQAGNITGILQYTKAAEYGKTIELVLNNATLFGDYTFALIEGFVMDNYRNLSERRALTIYKGNRDEAPSLLAEPYSIYQASENHSFIYVKFADRLDEATATDETNYSIAGIFIEEARLLNNTVNGATVRLTIPKGGIAATGERRIAISGIRGYQNSAEMADYSGRIHLVENRNPELKSIKYDPVAKNKVDLIFTEQIEGRMIVRVVERSNGMEISNWVTVAGNTVSIELGRIPADGTYLLIYILDNAIIDLSGNESTLNPILSAFVNY